MRDYLGVPHVSSATRIRILVWLHRVHVILELSEILKSILEKLLLVLLLLVLGLEVLGLVSC